MHIDWILNTPCYYVILLACVFGASGRFHEKKLMKINLCNLYLPFHKLLLIDVCIKMLVPFSTKFVIHFFPYERTMPFHQLFSTILSTWTEFWPVWEKLLKQVRLSTYTFLLKVVNFLKYESNPSNWISDNVFLPLKYLSATERIHNYFWSIFTSIFIARTNDKKLGKESTMMYCLPVRLLMLSL